MVFSSVIFIFIFLPVVLLVFHTLKEKLRFPFLLLSSLFFYFFGENFLIWIMLLSTFIDYFAGLLIANGLNRKPIVKLIPGGFRSKPQKLWLIVSVVANLSLLGYFKYFNFFTDNLINALDLMQMSHLKLDNLIKVGLPLGISFYTFQSMSYTIDVYRGEVHANRNFINFATFVTMFPQLVAGPIVRYSDIEEQLLNHKVSIDKFAVGAERFTIGLAKKVLIANTMGQLADQIFELEGSQLSTGLAWIGIIAYTLQIYFDFSGYSCMAIGLGKMFGFDFQENFNYPYISKSIQVFWRRWHITLSDWFRDYLYIPLGGNKASRIKTFRNLFIVFLLCGFWHGSSWNFVIWGLFHGMFLSIERLGLIRLLKRMPSLVSHIYVLLVVIISWVFFRSETLTDSINYLKVMFVFKPSDVVTASEFVSTFTIFVFVAGIFFSMPVLPNFLRLIADKNYTFSNILNLFYFLTLVSLLFFSTVFLVSGTYNPFIYFRF
jgi:alginate O-acetyltransferase complex protein AlgI